MTGGSAAPPRTLQYSLHAVRLRGYDAIHLACALALNEPLVDQGLLPLTFVAADDNLLAAAGSEGLATENPNDHS